MCHNLKIIGTVKSGELSFCKSCNIYHLEFNNIYFEFNLQQFNYFKTYILAIDSQFWEQKYACASFKRKIPIPSMQDNLVLMFNRQEIEELKSLINGDTATNTIINVDDIDYTFVLN